MNNVAGLTPQVFQRLLLDLYEDAGKSESSIKYATNRKYYDELMTNDIISRENYVVEDSTDESSEEEMKCTKPPTSITQIFSQESLKDYIFKLLDKSRLYSRKENIQISNSVIDLLKQWQTLGESGIIEELSRIVPSSIHKKLSEVVSKYVKSGEEEDQSLEEEDTAKARAVKLAKKLIIVDYFVQEISVRVAARNVDRDLAKIKTTNTHTNKRNLEKSLQSLKKYAKQIKESKELNKFLDEEADQLLPCVSGLNKEHTGQIYMNNSDPTGVRAKYQHVYIHSKSAPSNTISIVGNAIPENAYYKDSTSYVEVHVPAVETAPLLPEKQRISISSLPECIRSAFDGYDVLNTVQSITFHTAFGTNENMLVCAPTGAGKTDVALITILKVLMNHMSDGVVTDTQNFKIVYLTPMKALASEIVTKLSSRISKSKSDGGMQALVMEYTGDTALNRSEISAASVIVATPEKWDATTRSSLDESELLSKTCLLIIDEIHILNDTRGGIIESIVARFQRYVNIKQNVVRIVGLSATLPNYIDVANFLGVNPQIGMFFFDASYRPISLEQKFVGIKRKPFTTEFINISYQYCYEKVIETLKKDQQVMIFVHSRVDTLKTAKKLLQMITNNGHFDLISPKKRSGYRHSLSMLGRLHDNDIKTIFECGIGIHNAGLTRSGRNFMESMFKSGLVRVICTTTTLAWGVNMPASCVIIKGTRLYSPENSRFEDLPVTDVLQIFGRAGRPQYERLGTGYIITSHDKLNYYITSMLDQAPIESHFETSLADNLNAEIALGTVATVGEALKWLSYTFLSTRMNVNPMAYHIKTTDLLDIKSAINERKREIIISNAKILDRLQMIVFDEKNETLFAKDLGQIASSSYISYSTVEVFSSLLKPVMTAADVINTVCLSNEFEHLKTRKNEMEELHRLMMKYCILQSKGQIEDYYCKASILLQSHISRASIVNSTLFSDRAYIAKNASRMLNAMFKISCSRNWGRSSLAIHTIKKSVDNAMWPLEHQLRQFYVLPEHILAKLDNMKDNDIHDLREYSISDLGQLIRNKKFAPIMHEYLWYLPDVIMEFEFMPITRFVLKAIVKVMANFKWNTDIHGISEPWWLWVQDAEGLNVLHYEPFLIRSKYKDLPILLTFTIPLPETQGNKITNQLIISAFSDTWVGCEAHLPVSLSDINLPDRDQEHFSELLDLRPLPITALNDALIEKIYRNKFRYFNPLQTQIFHTLYNLTKNVLLGAPTGSGKTVAAELAIWESFRNNPRSIAVYIAPIKALVLERFEDWYKRLGNPLGLKIVKMTGEITPDVPTLNSADIIITTPEKWDGVTRFWRNRAYLKRVSLIIIDEIHLLGGDRGHVIEMSVTRMKVMGDELNKKIRIVGLSTAFSNALDVGEWIGAGYDSIFNFRNSVRPVPLEVHISSFLGKYYCPRMDSMNKPIYNSIISKSPDKPVIIFVSSRRQTRLTATDLISFSNLYNNSKKFLLTTEEDIRFITDSIHDDSLKFFLQFGVGIHHAGLTESDRKICEALFRDSKIQILVATSTLAWGVNFPAHMVIVKGTEYYDVSISGYRDFSITDVLQMMGRAGRPQFDSTGIAHIMVQDIKKDFYKRFLHEPFPLESILHNYLPDHMNAEIASGTIKTRDDMVNLLSKTFMYSRMHTNPSYYGVKDNNIDSINLRLSEMVNKVIQTLTDSNCVKASGPVNLTPTQFGRICAYYYISNHSIRLAQQEISNSPHIRGDMDSFVGLIKLISRFEEFSEVPVRHNEDKRNKKIESYLSYNVYEEKNLLGYSGMNSYSESTRYSSPHVKTFLLLLSRICKSNDEIKDDYVTDTYTILGSCIRVIQSAIDVSAELRRFEVCLNLMILLQCIKQCIIPDDNSLVQIPNITKTLASEIVVKTNWKLSPALYEMMNMNLDDLNNLLKGIDITHEDCNEVKKYLSEIPMVTTNVHIINAEKDKDGIWILEVDTVYKIKVYITRRHTNNCPCSPEHSCYTKDFPNTTRESWWCMLADEPKNDLIALSRLSYLCRVKDHDTNENRCMGTTTISFRSPRFSCKKELTLFVISDNYFGLDKMECVATLVLQKKEPVPCTNDTK